jgi:hypothetical protein
MNETRVNGPLTATYEAVWQRIVGYLEKGLALSEQEARTLARLPVAKYVAAIPYAARCRNPDRLAVMLVTLFMVEVRGGSPFDTRPSDQDGSLARIEPYFAPLYQAGGDAQVIDKAKYILGMKTFSHWIEEPAEHPSGLDFTIPRAELKVLAEALPGSDLLDSILTVEDGMINTWSAPPPDK